MLVKTRWGATPRLGLALTAGLLLSACQTSQMMSDFGDAISSANPFSDDADLTYRYYDAVAAWGPDRDKPSGVEGPPPFVQARCDASKAKVLSDRPASVHRSFELRHGVYDIPSAETYLNDILARVMSCAPVDDPPNARVFVEAVNITAGRIDKDGGIFIPIAFLAKAQSDDEVAFLVAHEYSHNLLNHQKKTDFATQRRELFGHLETASALVDAYAPEENEAVLKLKKSLRGPRMALRTSEVLFESNWGRSQEFEADLMAYDLVEAIGYQAKLGWSHYAANLKNSLTIQQRFEAMKPDERVKKEALAELQSDNPSVKGLRDSVLGELGQVGLDVAMNMFAESHPDADERAATILEYRELHYSDGEASIFGEEPSTAGIDALRKSKDFTIALESFQLAVGVINGLSATGEEALTLEQAEAKARQAVSNSDFARSNPLARQAFYQVRNDQGDRSNARRNLEIAIERNDGLVPLSVYTEWYNLEMRQNRTGQAGDVLKRALAAFPETVRLLPEQIRYYDQMGDRDEAAQARRRCLTVTQAYDIKERCLALTLPKEQTISRATN